MPITEQHIWKLLEQVKDPEVPVLSIMDLGIVRGVKLDVPEINSVTIIITPTYSGCPAMDIISIQIRMALLGDGIKKVIIEQQLSPAWTTDWMSESGKQKLLEYGIAPPFRKASNPLNLFESDAISCPRCNSDETSLISQFGPTSCKALYQCNRCKEPFEHFKCH